MKAQHLALLTSLMLMPILCAHAQTPAADNADIGAAAFARQCESCHAPSDNARAPSVAMLRGLAPRAVLTALTNGKMAVQADSLSDTEKFAVAEFVTGRTIEASTLAGSFGTRCPTSGALAAAYAMPRWNGWGAGLENTRYQSAANAGLNAEQVPRLQLAWAFGFADSLAARTQPAVVGNWLFTAGETGEVFALDTATGCTHWRFQAQAAVRTAMTVAPYSAADGTLAYGVYFGDGLATAYGLDAETGQLLWQRKIEEHPNAAITGAPAVFDGQVFIPVSSAGEEVRGRNPDYACCTFRGSVTALDMQTGAVNWKSYSITDPFSPQGKSANGLQLTGPAGAGIWGAPTIDAARGVLYVGTGNAYAGPQPASSDAILAMDLQTGSIRWTQQTQAHDIWLYQCDAASNVSNPSCPEVLGPDFDFSTAPLLAKTVSGRELLVVPQKSGMVYALDPDSNGAIVWEYRIGQGSSLGGQWGAAADERNAYVGVADTLAPAPGGMHAINLETGQPVWYAPPQPKLCSGDAQQRCFAAQGAAVSVIPGVVFSGGSDGGLRAYSALDGSVLWQFDTNREFETVNGVSASGATMDASGPVIAGGMVFVNSGYNGIVGRAGNVLLAFRYE